MINLVKMDILTNNHTLLQSTSCSQTSRLSISFSSLSCTEHTDFHPPGHAPLQFYALLLTDSGVLQICNHRLMTRQQFHYFELNACLVVFINSARSRLTKNLFCAEKKNLKSSRLVNKFVDTS